MFNDKKTEEATLDGITIADMNKYGGDREDIRARIEQHKRDEEYGLSWIKAVGFMALIFVAFLWCMAFGMFK